MVDSDFRNLLVVFDILVCLIAVLQVLGFAGLFVVDSFEEFWLNFLKIRRLFFVFFIKFIKILVKTLLICLFDFAGLCWRIFRISNRSSFQR